MARTNWEKLTESFSVEAFSVFMMITCATLLSTVGSFHILRTSLNRMVSSTTQRTMLKAGIHGNPAPQVMHAKLDISNDRKSRLIIVGDVHGCLEELKILLTRCSYEKERDEVIFVGDLVNKGPSSVDVIRFVRDMGASCVRGNHDDDALYYALKAKDETAVLPAHYQYVKDLSRYHDIARQLNFNFIIMHSGDVEWLTELPYTISIPFYNAVVVHAGFVPGLPIESQKPIDMYVIRTVPDTSGSDAAAVPWASMWRDSPHVYFGHDAKRGLQMYEHATGLDTGCCYGRKLSAIILPGSEIVQVDALKVYEKIKTKPR